MKRLTGLSKPYKYVVTCIIMQKTGKYVCNTPYLFSCCHVESSSEDLKSGSKSGVSRLYSTEKLEDLV